MTNAHGDGNPGDPSGSAQSFPQNMPSAPEHPIVPAGPYPYPTPHPVYYVGRPTHSLATTSLILSLVATFCFVTAIPGVIIGHMARKRIKEDPRWDGAGIALAAIIIGWIIIGGVLAYAAFVITMAMVMVNNLPN
ncbi:DUF4190 domain-containing protein [Saccharopolyspora taberi]|uniref:DUF4190 domain-containing protein n=1 Tax=Saccharopolyspora taberi TaxID=60895 RepID=A0ABN3V3D7_9PSEU